jgi:leucyl aminopeptidase
VSIECLCRPVFGPHKERVQDALWEVSGFSGNPGQTLLHTDNGVPVLLVGLGPAQEVKAASLREAAALASRVLTHVETAEWDFEALSVLALPPAKIAQTIAEGVTLGSYRPGTQAEKSARWQGPNEQTVAWSHGLAIGHAT